MRWLWLYIITSIVAFAYVVARAWFIPYTCDEAWTYSAFVSAPILDIILAKEPVANNHILNTLLTKIPAMFSANELALRLPNVLSFIFYLLAAYQIATKHVKGSFFAFIVFLLLLSNHTIFSYFALSRGYGISIGLMLLSIAYLMSFVREGKTKYAHLSMLLIVFATYASFTVLYVAAFIFGWVTLVLLKNGRNYNIGSRWLKSLKIVLPYPLLLSLIALYPIMRMSKHGELYYGGTNNFISDSFFTIVQGYYGRYYITHNKPIIATIAIIIVAMSMLAMLIKIILNRKNILSNATYIPIALLVFLLVVINLQFYIFDTHLPFHRTGLYFFPIFILTICTALQWMYTARQKFLATALSLTILLFGLYRLYKEADIAYTDEWWFDKYTKTVLVDINDYKIANSIHSKSNLHVFFPVNSSFIFYKNRDYSNAIEGVENTQEIITEIDPTPYDFVYAKNSADFSAYPNFVLVKTYGIKKEYVLYYNTKKSKEK